MKLGVVGNGMIVSWLFRDIRPLPQITAAALCVRERSRVAGETLARDNDVPKLYTDYEAFLADTDFETVYLGVANHVHYEYAKKALLAGKHVICEKPFTVRAAQARELAALAKERGLFLWEAFKIPYSPVFKAIRENLAEVGEIKIVQCNYSKISSRYDRYVSGEILPAFDPACAGGCLYDINLYNLHFVTLLFGKPEKITCLANYGHNGIDTSGTVLLEYDGFYAVCTGAKDSTSPSAAFIQGTKGYIRADGPVNAARYADLVLNGGRVRSLASDSQRGSLTDEMREFAAQLASKDTAACYEMLDHSVLLMELVDETAETLLWRRRQEASAL